MIPAQRRQSILKALEAQGVISINELVQALDVSHMTVRRDLQFLEKQGLVVTVSGGVQLTKRVTSEPSHQIKETLCAKEKARIGLKACDFIKDNACIYLDAGTTSLALAQNLERFEGLTIVSNDFAVINYLLGIYTPDPNKVVVKQAAVTSSQKRILISDSSKYGHVATFLAVPTQDLDVIITDDGISPLAIEGFKHAQLEVIVV